MISTLRIKFGHGLSQPPETITVAPVTIFVGPNNSGKSKILSEIEQYCRTGNNSNATVILDNLGFSGLTDEEINQTIDYISSLQGSEQAPKIEEIIIGSRHGIASVHKERLIRCLKNPTQNPREFCELFLKHNTIFLHGNTRIQLAGPQGIGDLQHTPRDSFQVLFKDDKKKKRGASYNFRGIWVLFHT